MFGVGVALVAVAAGMAILGTGGVAAFGMGALIGSLVVGGAGAVVGGAVGYATSGVDGILGGALAGFGIGAIVGFVVGGSINYYNYQSILVKNYISQYGGDVNQVLATYKGKPKIKVLSKDTTVFRTWGGKTGELGHWISPKNYGSAAKSKLALPPCNTAENTSQFLISKGSIVISGKAAPLFGQVGGGIQWWIGLL